MRGLGFRPRPVPCQREFVAVFFHRQFFTHVLVLYGPMPSTAYLLSEQRLSDAVPTECLVELNCLYLQSLLYVVVLQEQLSNLYHRLRFQ